MAEDEWAEAAEAAWEAECTRVDAAAEPVGAAAAPAEQQEPTGAAATGAGAAPGASSAISGNKRPAAVPPAQGRTQLRRRVPTADDPKKPAAKQLPPPLAVLKWCFYELLLARQPSEIAERAAGAKLPVTLDDVKPRADAQLASQGLELEGGVQLAHFAQLCSLVPSLVKLRWTVSSCSVSGAAAAALAGEPALDMIITPGKTAGVRLKLMDKVLTLVEKRATTAVKKAAKGTKAAAKSIPAEGAGALPVETALTIEAAIQAELPAPAAVPSKPSGPSCPRPADSSTKDRERDKDADE
jgi:hypothetical protein